MIKSKSDTTREYLQIFRYLFKKMWNFDSRTNAFGSKVQILRTSRCVHWVHFWMCKQFWQILVVPRIPFFTKISKKTRKIKFPRAKILGQIWQKLAFPKLTNKTILHFFTLMCKGPFRNWGSLLIIFSRWVQRSIS